MTPMIASHSSSDTIQVLPYVVSPAFAQTTSMRAERVQPFRDDIHGARPAYVGDSGHDLPAAFLASLLFSSKSALVAIGQPACSTLAQVSSAMMSAPSAARRGA
jgi:hypothetical protein